MVFMPHDKMGLKFITGLIIRNIPPTIFLNLTHRLDTTNRTTDVAVYQLFYLMRHPNRRCNGLSIEPHIILTKLLNLRSKLPCLNIKNIQCKINSSPCCCKLSSETLDMGIAVLYLPPFKNLQSIIVSRY